VLLTDFLSLPSHLAITDAFIATDLVVIAVTSTATTADCPSCGCASDYVHSRYRRIVADLPGHDRRAVLRVTARKFFCRQPSCPRSVFCERLLEVVAPHARSSCRLTPVHRELGLALGGEAGARLAEELAMPTSPDTILRRVKQDVGEPMPPPRFVGVDDWAWRKGQRYGTILIDLERRCVIDILQGRDGSTLAAWLNEHPGVEVITRDRWAAYAQAATDGAPAAQQVADRWHLLKNLREMVEQLLARFSTQVREALQEAPAAVPAAAATAEGPTEPVPAPLPIDQPISLLETATPKEQARQAKKQERVERYQRVRQLHAQGLSLRQIARATELSRGCVIRYLRADHCPDWNTGQGRPTQLDPFLGAINAWIERGGHNAADLHRELIVQGCRASYDAVRRHLTRRLGSTGRPGPRVGPLKPPPAPALPSARKLSFEFIRRPEERKAEEQARLDKLCGCEVTLGEGLDWAGEFAQMVRKRSKLSLAEWLSKAEDASCAELRSFAASLRQDEAAVAAALSDKWSNGPVEGQINRLKLIKRSMYGRAGFELLRARVRHAG
jgi:transposase